MKNKYTLFLLFIFPVIILNAQDKKMRCSYYNFGFNLGYINNKSLNDYINHYNTATSYSWGNTSLMYGMKFSLGYSRLGSPHHLTTNAGISVMSIFPKGNVVKNPAHQTNDKSGYTDISYSGFNLGIGYLHTPKGYEVMNTFFTYGADLNATFNQFGIDYSDGISKGTNFIYSTQLRAFLNFNIIGGEDSDVYGTIGAYAEYSIPNQEYTDFFNKHLSYAGAASHVYLNPASVGLTLSISGFPQSDDVRTMAQHVGYDNDGSYYKQFRSYTVKARNYNYVIKGKITDSVSAKPVNKALLIFSGSSFNPAIKLNSKIDGNYNIQLHLKDSLNYYWNVIAGNYLPYSDSVYITNINSYKIDTLIKNINLTPVSIGATIQPRNIAFAKGTTQLIDASLPDMDNMIAFLDLNPYVSIQIIGYTSSESKDERSDIKLSYYRALAVRNYLISGGINRRRIKLKSAYPVPDNKSRKNIIDFKIMKL